MQALREFHPNPQPAQGFWESLGLPYRGSDLHEAISEGLPFDFYEAVSELLGLDKKDLAKYAMIAPATLQRRSKAGRFSTEESDRLFNFASAFKAATDLFEGDAKRAGQWLTQPARGLGGRKPIEMLATRVGCNDVLDLIGRLEHGVFS